MSWKPTSRTRIVLIGGLAVVCFGLALGAGLQQSAAQTPVAAGAAPAPQAQPAPETRPADRDGVKKAADGFVAAFQKGDANALAALWTAEGEYIGDDGHTIHGRAALEKDYAEAFAKNPGNTLELEIEAIRFPSRDNAVVEGHFKLHRPKTGEFVASRCSFLYAREEGTWLLAIAREWPSDGLTLRDLEWLIGTWEARRDGTIVSAKYEWTKNKTFIRCSVTSTQDGQAQTAMQMIGKMPSTGGLHIWTFEDAGGIGDADITRDGKKWLFATRGSTTDGRVITATNIMTPVNSDSFTWQTVERTADGEPLPDQPQIKVTRVKGIK